MSNDQKEAEQQKPSSRNWQDLGKQYRTIGIAAVAAAFEIFGRQESKPAPRKIAVRYLGNNAA